jgi:peptide/nickel transport system substrate-binding protein
VKTAALVVITAALALALGMPATSGPATPAPQPGGTLVIGRGVDSVTLSPYASASPDAEVIAHVAETLYRLTPEGRIEPLLAERMPQLSADGRAMTIPLRRGIRFHDGTPFDAAAVKWNFDFIMNPENRAPFRAILLGEVAAWTCWTPTRCG